VIALCVDEPKSEAIRSVLRGDPSLVAWWSTRTECLSGFLRRSREGSISGTGLADSRAALTALADSWVEVQPSESVRSAAERLLAAHALRAAGAVQLAAALVWCGGQTRGAEVVSFDGRLREAALREGFGVLPLR
jgi:predicted nucleic acid-binding protein